jgi:formate hydrogenlyase transcriptional activator
VLYLQETINEEYNFGEMVGASPAFKKVVHDVEKVAWSDSTVLICGETGTGKELIAHAIHAHNNVS